jgi:hypothetical protein
LRRPSTTSTKLRKPITYIAAGAFEPVHIEQAPWEEAARGTRFAMRYQHLSSFAGGFESASMSALKSMDGSLR